MKKKYLLTVLAIILLLFINARNNIVLTDFTKVREKTYIYNFEVSIEEYYKFLKDNNYQTELLPDTTVFKDTSVFGTQIIPYGFSKEYFSLKFNKYPAVGISSKQAEQYCKWLFASGKIKGEIKEIRLPNINEHYSALYHQTINVEFEQNGNSMFIQANNNDDNQWTDLNHFDLSKTFFNNMFNENLSGIQDGYVHLCPINAYYKNKIVNLLGNVSEWVYVDSLIVPVGNNFSGELGYCNRLSNPSYCTFDKSLITSNDIWDKPSAKIGFRYVVVMK
ncbi:SUMF1/EgtB/PvdO family nonheme iron enzyme [Cytophaga hutchinsonii]|uniref:Sulfatase-modifying factor enzyme-like domain-containing protein n=1 Tax=Cytophaga hutchinsonii (strain ATCC 33406 / DSM 1761 / CIP 103989 / NBRC 15051 / NCIMB 9469 / D465) TaxID=269798 RepID=A0A6N4SUQ3_CYTH3|nr:SUMF1/EgtB/PvdO family nonheme iron enzyme [Cytophaga hutchinsonii]ABG60204.1 hypothetical protein CHU_2962 [Cytophaga hutchinsonii ATCC 33406]SFX22001.1 Sulfatase-modifying factor enzyme 1 [Cytophaga hutchinsonii ATCC 33406]